MGVNKNKTYGELISFETPARIENCPPHQGTFNTYKFKLQGRLCQHCKLIEKWAENRYNQTGNIQDYELFVMNSLCTSEQLKDIEEEEIMSNADKDYEKRIDALIDFSKNWAMATFGFCIILWLYIYVSFEYRECVASDIGSVVVEFKP